MPAMGKQMEDNGKAAKSAIVRLDKFPLPSGWFADRNDRVASSKLLQITIGLTTFSAVADAVVAGGKKWIYSTFVIAAFVVQILLSLKSRCYF